MKNFQKILQDVQENRNQWVNAIENGTYPEAWNGIDCFRKMVLARCICPANTIEIVTNFIEGKYCPG